MGLKLFGIFLIGALLLFGCTQQTASTVPVTPTAKALAATAQPTLASIPKAEPFQAPEVANVAASEVPPVPDVPAIAPTVAAQPAAPEVQSFSVETDDNGWYP
ncbi:MAG TPA: hypothetical protein VI874_05020, partial [Candidatus Norongarragalinales archaeon]|nr:hypothetical protein [Candidatus Norongarragalinales archaeon]